MKRETVVAVLEKLGLDSPAADLTGLHTVYAAWCHSVSFDNVLKLIHQAEERRGPLPGSTTDSFFAAWLEHGTGGTCWAGNAALHDLLEALGFDVARAIATMLSSPEATVPNHGSVIVTVEGAQWIADASILSGKPIRIPPEGEAAAKGPLPRFEWLDGSAAVVWRGPSAPEGFPCRIERVGADAGEWDERHQRTGAGSPFNYQLNVRVLHGETSIGISSGQRFTIGPDGSVSASPLEQEERVRFLIEEIRVSEEIAVQVPATAPCHHARSVTDHRSLCPDARLGAPCCASRRDRLSRPSTSREEVRVNVSSQFDVSGFGVIVTGGASGLGLAYGEVLAAHGARVTLIDVDGGAVAAQVARLQGEGLDARGAIVDVTDHAALDRAIDEAADAYGRLDVAFANAGIDPGVGFVGAWAGGERPRMEDGAVERYTDERWNRVIDINLNGVFATARAAARHMRPGRFGRIIVTTSLAATKVEPAIGSAYMTAKAGARHLMHCLALELAADGITANAIAPGFFVTNIGGGHAHDPELQGALAKDIPMHRVGRPDDIKALALFLASPASEYITGQEIVIDGGWGLGVAD